MKSIKLLALLNMLTLAGCDIINKEDIEPSSFTNFEINNDEYSIEKGETVVVDFLRNDSITSEISVTVGDPVHGTLTKDSSTSFIYEPEPIFVGVDSFRYTICNKVEQCAEGSVVINVGETYPTGNEEITTEAVLNWTGDYAVDGCGFIITIDGTEYKAENESVIDERFKESQAQVILTYTPLEKKIEKFCGDKPDPFVFEAIRILSIEN